MIMTFDPSHTRTRVAPQQRDTTTVVTTLCVYTCIYRSSHEIAQNTHPICFAARFSAKPRHTLPRLCQTGRSIYIYRLFVRVSLSTPFSLSLLLLSPSLPRPLPHSLSLSRSFPRRPSPLPKTGTPDPLRCSPPHLIF